jgi:hypothetical protein
MILSVVGYKSEKYLLIKTFAGSMFSLGLVAISSLRMIDLIYLDCFLPSTNPGKELGVFQLN